MEIVQSFNIIIIFHLICALIILGYFNLAKYQPDNLDLLIVLIIGPEILIFMIIYSLIKGGKR